MKVRYLQIHSRVGMIVPVSEVLPGEKYHYTSNKWGYKATRMLWRNGNRQELCGHKMKHADNTRGFFNNGNAETFNGLVEIVEENYYED